MNQANKKKLLEGGLERRTLRRTIPLLVCAAAASVFTVAAFVGFSLWLGVAFLTAVAILLGQIAVTWQRARFARKAAVSSENKALERFPFRVALSNFLAALLIGAIGLIAASNLGDRSLLALTLTVGVPVTLLHIAFLVPVFLAARNASGTVPKFVFGRRWSLISNSSVASGLAIIVLVPAVLTALILSCAAYTFQGEWVTQWTTRSYIDTAQSVIHAFAPQEAKRSIDELTSFRELTLFTCRPNDPFPPALSEHARRALRSNPLPSEAQSYWDPLGKITLSWVGLNQSLTLASYQTRSRIVWTDLLFLLSLVGFAILLGLVASLLLDERVQDDVFYLVRRLDSVPESKRTTSHIRALPSDFLALNGRINKLHSRFENMRQTQQSAVEAGRQAREVKVQFFAGMSHDLRSPLNSVIGFTDLLLKEMEGPLTEEQRSGIKFISKQSEQVMSLIADILDTTKLDAGHMELDRAWVPSVEILTETTAEARRLAGKQGIELVSIMQPALPPMFVDKERIEQAFVCLLTRAMQSTDHGTVRLQTSQERASLNERWLKVEITDPNRAISLEERRKIREAYWSAQSIQSRSSTGSLALSMALAKDIIQLHGGDLQVVGDEYDSTLFVVLLPLDETGVSD